MAQWIEQSTAVTVIMGPAVDKDDGVTPEPGLAAGTVDEIGVYKHGATSLTDISGTTTFTHRAGGMYTMTLSIADTGTLGLLTAYVRDDSVCLPFWKDFMVVPSNVWDSLFGADRLQVDVVQWLGQAVTADNNVPEVHVVDMDDDVITAAKFDEATAFPLVLVDTGATQMARVGADGDTLETLSDQLDVIETDSSELQTDWADGGRLDLLLDAIKAVTDLLPDAGALNDLAAILTDTDELQADWVDGGRLDLLLDAIRVVTDLLPDAGALNDLAAILIDTNELQGLITAGRMAAQVQGIDDIDFPVTQLASLETAMQNRIEANDLDHLIQVAAGIEEPTDGSYLDQIMNVDGAQTFDAATDSLEAIRDRGDAAWFTCAGVGAVRHTVTVEDGSGNPIADADVWITSDEDGTTTVASGRSDSNGKFYFWGDTGVTYWVWKQKDRFTFVNPTEFVIP